MKAVGFRGVRLQGSQTLQLGVSVLLLAVLAAAPAFYPRLSLLFFILNWVVIAESFNMFAGLTGYVNFGHVVFYGVGGYTSALLMTNWGYPSYAAIVVGGLAASVLAFGISLPPTRLTGAYFAIASLSLMEAFLVVFGNLPAVGSAPGFTLPLSYYQPVQEYYAMLVVAALCVATMFLLTRSKIGVALKAIRLQENTAKSIGINPALYKTMALVLSGFFAGMAGALSIWQIFFIDPTSAFNINITVNAISMAMLGGLGTLLGPVIGAAVLYPLGDYLDLNFTTEGLHLMILGVIVIAVVLVIPKGILGAAEKLIAKGKKGEGGSG